MCKEAQDLMDVIKYNQIESEKLQNDLEARLAQIRSTTNSGSDFDKRIAERLNKLKKQCQDNNINYKIEEQVAKQRLENILLDIDERLQTQFKETKEIRNPYYYTYDELVELAHKEGIVGTTIPDILTPEQIAKADQEYDNLEREFSQKTGIFNKRDITFLMIATAAQVIRWVVSNEIGNKIDPDTRMSDKDGDQLVKEEKKKYQKEHSQREDGDWESTKISRYKSWEEIIFSSVPYDATKGAAEFGLNLEGRYHRVHTLGHDPLLGWIFGTLNILTSTLTIPNMRTFFIAKKNIRFIAEITLAKALQMSYETLNEDWHRLPAATFRQYLHVKSDALTKLGLPIPLLEVFSEELAGELYKSQYDSLCLLRDVRTVAQSAMISILIDMVVGLVHGLFYEPNKDGERKLYEVRTRKILLISHVISSASNVIYCTIMKNPKKLDIGGLLVTIGRLFLDIRFIRRVKFEYINSRIDEGIQREIDKLKAIEASL